MKNRNLLLMITAFLLLLMGCEEKVVLYKQKGFIVFNGNDEWSFIPTKTLDTNECQTAFQSKNFEEGIDFKPEFPKMTLIEEIVDTFRIKIIADGYVSFYTEKVVPVYIEYEVRNEKIDWNIKREKDTTTLVMNNQKIKFSSQRLTLKVLKLTPLYCFNKRRSDVKICSCEHRMDDPNDYLYKICRFIKTEDQNTSYPCKLNIKEIIDDSLDNNKVIKVVLTCCYTGDIAYFHPVTKELIKISYGPK